MGDEGPGTGGGQAAEDRSCPDCGARWPVGVRWCGACGSRLPEAPTPESLEPPGPATLAERDAGVSPPDGPPADEGRQRSWLLTAGLLAAIGLVAVAAVALEQAGAPELSDEPAEAAPSLTEFPPPAPPEPTPRVPSNDLTCSLVSRLPPERGPDGWGQLSTTPDLLAEVSVARIHDRLLVATSHGSPDAESRLYAYHPAEDFWECLPTLAPVSADQARVAASDDTLFLISGAKAASLHATGRRDLLPEMPHGRTPFHLAWTGNRLLGFGDLRDESPFSVQGATYDPAVGEWEPIAEGPLQARRGEVVWIGSHLAVVSQSRAVLYDPTVDQWTDLPENGLDPNAMTAAWTGDRLVAYDYGLASGYYTLPDGEWHDLPELPLDAGECYPQAAATDRGDVFAWYCGQAALLPAGSDTWLEVATPAWDAQGAPTGFLPNSPVAIGSDIYLLQRDGSGGPGIWRFTPAEILAP